MKVNAHSKPKKSDSLIYDTVGEINVKKLKLFKQDGNVYQNNNNHHSMAIIQVNLH